MKRVDSQQARQRFVAWLLLVLFMMPIVVKAMHVCHLHETEVSCKGNAGHKVDKCAICHFVFVSFEKPLVPVLPVLYGIVISTVYAALLSQYAYRKFSLSSLRAPPGVL